MSRPTLQTILDGINGLAHLSSVPEVATMGIEALLGDARPIISHLSGKESMVFPTHFRPSVGMRLPGTDYVLTKALTTTGLSTLWHAEQCIWPDPRRLMRPVVVKFIMLAGMEQKKKAVILKRARREAKVAGYLVNHPGIVELYHSDVLYDENGEPVAVVLVYEDHDCDLEALGKALGHRFPLRLARHLILQTCQALAYAHNPHVGVTSRDIKPANILIALAPGKRRASAESGSVEGGHSGGGDPLGRCNAKLTDFGLARESDPDALDATLTHGGMLGTVMFMPPEQAKGRHVNASDVYSLGETWKYVLTGRLPFHTESFHPNGNEILTLLLQGKTPTPLRELLPEAAYLPQAMIEVFDGMTVFEPSKRLDIEECIMQFEEMQIPRDPPNPLAQTMALAAIESGQTSDGSDDDYDSK